MFSQSEEDFKSAAISYANLLDSLADFGVVMIVVSNPEVTTRVDWMSKHLTDVAATSDHMYLMALKMRDSKLLSLCSALKLASLRLTDSFMNATLVSADMSGCHDIHENAVSSWDNAHAALKNVAEYCGLCADSRWMVIDDRRPEYKRLVEHLVSR